MMGMGDQLPMGGNGSGTLVLGDITIVQNHNFGMGGNPQQMMQMQQQLAIQQQQNMMMLGMAATVARQNKLLQAALGTVNDLTYPKEALPVEEKKMLIAEPVDAKEKRAFVVDAEVQTVEYSVIEDDPKPNIVDLGERTVVKHHMGKFFTNGELNDDVQFNRFYKVEEDTRTVVIFIKKNKTNLAAWRKTFRESYLEHQKLVKGPLDKLITQDDTIYIVVLLSTQGGKPDIIFINKTGLGPTLTSDLVNEYISGVGMEFGSVYKITEPMVPEDTISDGKVTKVNNDVNYVDNPICHLKDSIFSHGLYLVSDMCL